MNLKQLEAFVKVAETKNFSEAARQLYLTQPTVSAHVASLEKELDTSLLCRNTKKVELTDAGRELCVYAEEMLGIERKIREHFGLRGRKGGCCASRLLQYRLSIFFPGSWRAIRKNIRESSSG